MGLKRDNEECAHELGGSEDDISGYEDEVNSDEEVELGDGDPHNGVHKEDEMEELEREYSNLRNQEEDLLRNLKRNKEDDALKGQAVKNQKALWDRMLEIRILLQKVFATANKLPQEPLRSSFCGADEAIGQVYAELLASTKLTLDSCLELQEAVIKNNSAIEQVSKNGIKRNSNASSSLSNDSHPDEMEIEHKPAGSNQHERSKQNDHEDADGEVPDDNGKSMEEDSNVDGDPELLDDSEFYQQLLKEFLESFNPDSTENIPVLQKTRTKKRKVVDRRPSKSRKIRYHVHEKIVNFMAPEPMDLPPMAPKLF